MPLTRTRQGHVLKIILTLFVFCMLGFLLMKYFLGTITSLPGQQIQAIRDGDLQKAYAMTTNDFQKETSFKEFKDYVDHYSVLKDNKKVIFDEKKVHDEQAYFKGVIEANDGSQMEIEYQLIKEDKVWKIQGMRLSVLEDVAHVVPDKPKDASGAEISDILVNDSADKDGYVTVHHPDIPASAKKIYATVQLSVPNRGVKIKAILVNKEGGGQIGPVTGDVDETGPIMKAFSFSRDVKSWPKGEYEIQISLSSGAAKTVKFKVAN